MSRRDLINTKSDPCTTFAFQSSMQMCLLSDPAITHLGRDKMASIPDDIFKCIFLNENIWIVIANSLTFILKCQINNIPALI